MADSCSVVGVGDIEEVAVEAAEAKYDVCKFLGGETVDSAVATGVVADDGEVVRLRCGLAGAAGLGVTGEVGKDKNQEAG